MLSAPTALAILYNVGLAVAIPTAGANNNMVKLTMEEDKPDEPIGSEGFFLKLGLSAVLVMLGGAFAGLTIGLMGLDPLHLQVLANAADDPKERADAKVVLKSILKGVQYLHAHDIVHRDLKPENILYRTKETDSDIVIVDFGIAKHLDAPDEVLHSLAGSFGYVAPEVLLNKGHSKSVDLWSTGSTDAKELIVETTAGRIEFHERFWKNVSGEAKAFIMSLLQVDPNRRPTATQALQDKWLTEATAASSEIDIGEGLRQNFDPKAKWKQAIFKVKVNNSLAKLPSRVGTGGVVKDGRTTSDEEDNDDDDDDDEVSIFEVKKKNGTAGSVDSTSTKSLGGKEDVKQKEVKKEEVKQKAPNE
ncbi:hypothetical protein FRB90_009466, partial [Tulasnella sp. 427]